MRERNNSGWQAVRWIAAVLLGFSLCLASASAEEAEGVITTVAGTGAAGYSGDGGLATQAQLFRPFGIAIDGGGNLYIADRDNHRVRKVDAQTGVITTVAGTGAAGYSGDGGLATAAGLFRPGGMAIDGAGNLYIADRNNGRVRKVDAQTGVITTVAGMGARADRVPTGDGGLATAAEFAGPTGVAIDGAGNLYIAARDNDQVRKVDAQTGVITTVAGTGAAGYSGDGGLATQAQLAGSARVAIDGAGNLYIADQSNHRVRKVDAQTGVITTVAGTGVWGFSGDGGLATQAQLFHPSGVTIDGGGNLYIADLSNHRVRKVAGIAVGVGCAASEDIRELIDSGADLAAQDERGLTVLHWAGIEGRPCDIRALVEAGAHVDAPSRGGRLTALHFAVWRRAGLETVNALIAAGADVNARDQRGWTALHWAARDRRGDPAEVEALIAAGADVNVQDNALKQTALGYALRADIRNEAVAALLRAAGGF